MSTVVGMGAPGPELDAARARVVEHDLVADAIGHLTPVVTELPLEALTSVKRLLKRFFSRHPWTEHDDVELAEVVGNGDGSGRTELEPGLTLSWGWEDDRFRVRVEADEGSTAPREGGGGQPGAHPSTDLGATFAGTVVPEATPSPRTIRFATPLLHSGPSRAYESAADADADPRVARIFDELDEATHVLVGPGFVAVTIAAPNGWERLLGSALRVIEAGFTTSASEEATDPATAGAPAAPAPRSAGTFTPGSAAPSPREPGRVERAWAELGGLRGDRTDDLDRILAAAHDTTAVRRQVAAALLADAPPDAAAGAWEHLLDDPSRSVRRSAVDTMAGAEREALRPLLERALDDADAWTRWKALHGIAGIGLGSSRAAVDARATDPDFRVRLEAARLLAIGGRSD